MKMIFRWDSISAHFISIMKFKIISFSFPFGMNIQKTENRFSIFEIIYIIVKDGFDDLKRPKAESLVEHSSLTELLNLVPLRHSFIFVGFILNVCLMFVIPLNIHPPEGRPYDCSSVSSEVNTVISLYNMKMNYSTSKIKYKLDI